MPQIFDLEKAVEQWAMVQYEDTATRRQKKLLKKDRKHKHAKYLGKQIDWTDVVFENKTIWSNLERASFDNDGDDNDIGIESQQTPNSHKDNLVHSNVLFETHYSNSTDAQQEYTIRTEKTTRSTCTTSLDHSFTKGMEMSVTMKSPGELVEASAGFHAEETLTNSAGQEFEEELTWGVESLIKVKPGHRADAQLIVEEKKNKGDFEVITKAHGMVYVTFTNNADNNSFVKATGHDLAEIVKWYKNREARKQNIYEFVTVDDETVTLRTRGRCDFRYGVKQEIKVKEVPMNGQKSK